ncbi:MAG TPA: phosphatidate cytidylyltransferase [Stellaceae bacterium]|nr:phosphatidate cytidylyltransferase [Stellaceae bacterium]
MSGYHERWDIAFAHPLTGWIAALVIAILLLGALIIGLLQVAGRLSPEMRRELWLRLGSWSLLAPAMGLPILAGRLWVIVAVTLLGLACFREYSRATGLFRERFVSFFVVLGIFAVNLASADHWYAFFMALIPLSCGCIAVASIPFDHPQGYVQRVALGLFAFFLFGAALAHLGYMANDANYRPLLLLLLLAVGLNDVVAYVVGKTLGGPKLLPHTSPNKTFSGAVGALVLTTGLVAMLARPIFVGTAMDDGLKLVGLGAIVSVAGQLGDLMLSSIKRDIGIKDMGVAIPGHGGILDRFNSLLLVAPSVFHYVGYFVGFGLDQPTRVWF